MGLATPGATSRSSTSSTDAHSYVWGCQLGVPVPVTRIGHVFKVSSPLLALVAGLTVVVPLGAARAARGVHTH